MSTLVTLTTDYGHSDGYVGALKGAILAAQPDVCLVDISHHVPPQDCLAGAMCLLTATRHFSPGTVHLAVVDPEVGSARAGLIVKAWQQWYVGPDSGVLHFPLTAKGAEIFRITAPRVDKSRTTTFDGRDWLGPVAGSVACGSPVTSLAEPTDDFATLNLPAPQFEDYRWLGHVLHTDHFGNVISDLPAPPAEVCAKVRVFVGDQAVGAIQPSYASVEAGRPVATIGALATVEASLNGGNAQARWQVRRGQKFEILFPERVAVPPYPAWELP